jgi:hypothetical protein
LAHTGVLSAGQIVLVITFNFVQYVTEVLGIMYGFGYLLLRVQQLLWLKRLQNA